MKAWMSSNFGKFATELRPLINVRIEFLLNILKTNRPMKTKFCIHIIIDKIYVGNYVSPCKGRETYCFSPCVCLCVCLPVCLSVTKSCPLYNLITFTDISMKLHTFVKYIETTCHAQEP